MNVEEEKNNRYFFVCKDTSLFRSISFAMMEHIIEPWNLRKINTQKFVKFKCQWD